MKNCKNINCITKCITGLLLLLLVFYSIPNINQKAKAETTLKLTTVSSTWANGYNLNLTITNTSNSVIDGWILTLKKSDFTISNIWCAKAETVGDSILITPESWNRQIQANGSVCFGFIGQGTFVPNFSYDLRPSNSAVTPTPVVSVTPTPTPVVTVTPTPTPVVTVTPTPTPTVVPTQIKGSEVLVIGDSFFALSHEITKNLEAHAKEDGILASNDHFRDNSVSGTQLSGGISPSIPTQYKNAINSGAVKYVIMDGGGNDCLNSSSQPPYNENTPSIKNATTATRDLLNQMQRDGVIKVYYVFYPDPVQDYGGLKARLDVLRPLIKNIVDTTSSPQTFWLDLRPTFEGKYSQYILSDGIHPTSAGSKAVADVLWKNMMDNNFFGLK